MVVRGKTFLLGKVGSSLRAILASPAFPVSACGLGRYSTEDMCVLAVDVLIVNF